MDKQQGHTADDIFAIVDALGLRDNPPPPEPPQIERPSLLELYTRRSRRIDPMETLNSAINVAMITGVYFALRAWT